MKIKLLVLLFIMFVIMSFVVSVYEKEYYEKGMFSGLDMFVVKIVIVFYYVFNMGDKIIVKSLLVDDVIIYEGGGVERSVDEYV